MGCGAGTKRSNIDDPSAKGDNKCILIIGAPASGKGTQAEKIKAQFGFYGDLLREEIKNNTPLGQKAKEFMNAGQLVPDDLIFEIIGKTLAQPQCSKVMFDGFPRTLDQAKKLDEMLRSKGQKLVAVMYLDVPDDGLVERGTGRRIHQPSGRSYHIVYKPPKVEGKDDVTGEPLMQRDDDKEETIRKRLETFHKNNEPILKYYEEQKIVHRVKGDAKIDEVWSGVEGILKPIMQ